MERTSEEYKLPEIKHKWAYRLNAIVFILLLTVMGSLFFILPKKNFSEFEKRELCQMPDFSWEGVFYGNYVDSLDLYVADNFPFRDKFVAFSFGIEDYRGLQSEEVKFYNESINMDAGIETVGEEDSTAIDSTGQANVIDKPEDEFFTEGQASDVERLSRGLLIYDGMAIQMFGGSKNTAKYIAKMVNGYQQALSGKEVNVYLGVTPTHGEFYLPTEYIKEAVSEKDNIDTIYKYLDPEVRPLKVGRELFKHKDEYIFFNTDHHWTGKGAYYAYRAFCKAADIKPVELKDMEYGVIPNFLGTLYRKTRDQRLKENKDSVEYFKVPIRYKAYSLSGPAYNIIRNYYLYVELAKGGNAYGVFLGGDRAAMCVVSKQENGRRALVVKNSYGNPFSTYFVSHFERTYIIDYRYFKANILDFIEKNKVTDLIFFHNSFSANTPSHVDMTRKMMSDSTKCIAHTLPSWEVMFPRGNTFGKLLEEIRKIKKRQGTQGQNTTPNVPKRETPTNDVSNQQDTSK